MKIDIFWKMTPCCLVSRCNVCKMALPLPTGSRGLVFFNSSAWRQRQCDRSKCQERLAQRHGVTCWKTCNFSNTAASTSKLEFQYVHKDSVTVNSPCKCCGISQPSGSTVCLLMCATLQQRLCSQPAINFNFYRFQKTRQTERERKKERKSVWKLCAEQISVVSQTFGLSWNFFLRKKPIKEVLNQ
jgi:hypothetical protein